MKLMAILLCVCSSLAQAKCLTITNAEWQRQKGAWHERTLLGVASWCSSCKEKLTAAAKNPHDYVIFVAFDDPERVERTLAKLQITSPCIAGEKLSQQFGVSQLPWSKAIATLP